MLAEFHTKALGRRDGIGGGRPLAEFHPIGFEFRVGIVGMERDGGEFVSERRHKGVKFFIGKISKTVPNIEKFMNHAGAD